MYCRLPGVSIYYEARGRGRPFVMLHGSPSDHTRAMVQVEPAFRSRTGWRRFYPDLPGHGKSPGAKRIRDMDDYLDVVLEFIDDVATDERFALGGISFGAYLALAVARRRGPQVAGLMLSVPEVNHSPREELRDRRFGTPSILTPRGKRPGLSEYSEDTEWLEGLPFRDLSVPLYRPGSNFRAPTLLLFGRQDAPFRYRTYWRLLNGFPRATYAILDAAGHTLWTDRNPLAAALVRDWLDRIQDDRRSPSASRRARGPTTE